MRPLTRVLLLAGLPLFAFLLYRFGMRRVQPPPSAEETVLAEQTEALQGLVDAADRGALLSFRHVLVVVDQSLVQDLLRAALPIEGPVGAFRVRLDSADASFGDGIALVHLNGKATLVESSVTADLKVYGGLEVLALDHGSGLLRCGVRVYGVEADRANVLGIDGPLRGLTESLSHGGLAALLRFVEIPVRVDDRLAIPAVHHKRLRIRAAQVPVRADVADVKVFGGKLWVALAEPPVAPVAVSPAPVRQ